MSIDTSIYPNISIRTDDVPFSRGSDRYVERELKARKYYQDLALKGDVGAKLLLKTHWRLSKLTLGGKEVF